MLAPSATKLGGFRAREICILSVRYQMNRTVAFAETNLCLNVTEVWIS